MIRNYVLEIAVFICGAVVMIFELVGSRILAPYLGTSIFIWTSLIGIILGSLAIGYFWGGKLADKKASPQGLSSIIFVSGVFIGLTVLLKEPVLVLATSTFLSLQESSVLVSLILFAPPAVVLGMVSPYAVKMRINDLNTSGSAVGNLYAISTVGSIAGTFLAGFFLVPYFGTTKILFFLTFILIFVSITLVPYKFLKIKFLILLCLSFIFIANNFYWDIVNKKMGIIEDIDTLYSRVFLYETIDPKTRRPTLNLITSPAGAQSGMYLDGDDELVFQYTRYFRLAKHFKPDLKKSLMLGGGAYSYPKDYLKKFPEAVIDVVEIDPGFTEIAERYFGLDENPRLSIFHEDGRTFLNRAENNPLTRGYDAVFIDAFTSFLSPPYQLTTREAVQKIYDTLNKDGVVIVNIISSIDGPQGKFLRAEYATYGVVFPQTYVFPVDNPDDGERFQNIILVALKSELPPVFSSNDKELDGYLKHLWQKEIKTDIPILTDDHAPVEYLYKDFLL